MKPKLILGFALVLSGIVLVGVFKVAFVFENGELFESHIAPGKPTIDIRMFGLADMGFNAFLVEGWKQKKIFDLLECHSPDFGNSTNTQVRHYDGTISTASGRLPIFQILWSGDTNRVGIAFNGYFVAGYDCKTGKRIQFADYINMNMPRENGVPIWHDYKKCDADIEQFLRVEPENKP
jgi:hypothetical protein